MLKGLGDLGQLMKLQKEMKSTQNRISKARLDGSSSDGSVSAVLTGEYRLVDIKISSELAAAGDAKKLEKMVTEAVNNAVDNVKQFSAEEMNKLTGGMNIPGLNGMMK
jgi:DNA-binding YbaB/EbfC family protein